MKPEFQRAALPDNQVAPFTGAWIETSINIAVCPYIESHPSRVRGLKREVLNEALFTQAVAPFTGAWIETRKQNRKRSW